eukprot:TRINITY_DN16734_c0_g1_i1.p1 TRINITY_DN16734_c0_g1~~TRINITY_DN16734_c0_g1_i1.p1  ORF type:complete len:518 (+),score=54.48 TRINITY_DN16734_c0_g1_i1:70-1623(+)
MVLEHSMTNIAEDELEQARTQQRISLRNDLKDILGEIRQVADDSAMLQMALTPRRGATELAGEQVNVASSFEASSQLGNVAQCSPLSCLSLQAIEQELQMLRAQVKNHADRIESLERDDHISVDVLTDVAALRQQERLPLTESSGAQIPRSHELADGFDLQAVYKDVDSLLQTVRTEKLEVIAMLHKFALDKDAAIDAMQAAQQSAIEDALASLNEQTLKGIQQLKTFAEGCVEVTETYFHKVKSGAHAEMHASPNTDDVADSAPPTQIVASMSRASSTCCNSVVSEQRPHGGSSGTFKPSVLRAPRVHSPPPAPTRVTRAPQQKLLVGNHVPEATMVPRSVALGQSTNAGRESLQGNGRVLPARPVLSSVISRMVSAPSTKLHVPLISASPLDSGMLAPARGGHSESLALSARGVHQTLRREASPRPAVVHQASSSVSPSQSRRDVRVSTRQLHPMQESHSLLLPRSNGSEVPSARVVRPQSGFDPRATVPSRAKSPEARHIASHAGRHVNAWTAL